MQAALQGSRYRLRSSAANLQLGNYAGWRYTPLDRINRDNVKDLKIGWQASTGVLRGHEGGPLVVNGMLFFQTPQPYIVYAIDLDNPCAGNPVVAGGSVSQPTHMLSGRLSLCVGGRLSTAHAAGYHSG
jgi:hypothetical protein